MEKQILNNKNDCKALDDLLAYCKAIQNALSQTLTQDKFPTDLTPTF